MSLPHPGITPGLMGSSQSTPTELATRPTEPKRPDTQIRDTATQDSQQTQSATPPPTPPNLSTDIDEKPKIRLHISSSAENPIDLTSPSPEPQVMEENPTPEQGPIEETGKDNLSSKEGGAEEEDVTMEDQCTALRPENEGQSAEQGESGVEQRKEAEVEVAISTTRDTRKEEEVEEGEIQDLLDKVDPRNDKSSPTKGDQTMDIDVITDDAPHTSSLPLNGLAPPSLLNNSTRQSLSVVVEPVALANSDATPTPAADTATTATTATTSATSEPASAAPDQTTFKPISSTEQTLKDSWNRVMGKTSSAPTSVDRPSKIPRQLSPSSEPEEASTISKQTPLAQPSATTTPLTTPVLSRLETERRDKLLLGNVLADPNIREDVRPALRTLWPILNPAEKLSILYDKSSLSIHLGKHLGTVLVSMSNAAKPALHQSTASPGDISAMSEYDRFTKWYATERPDQWASVGLPIVNKIFGNEQPTSVTASGGSASNAGDQDQFRTAGLAAGLPVPTPHHPNQDQSSKAPVYGISNGPNIDPNLRGTSIFGSKPASAASHAFSPHAIQSNYLQQAANISRQQQSVIHGRNGSLPTGLVESSNQSIPRPPPRPASQPSVMDMQRSVRPMSQPLSAPSASRPLPQLQPPMPNPPQPPQQLAPTLTRSVAPQHQHHHHHTQPVQPVRPPNGFVAQIRPSQGLQDAMRPLGTNQSRVHPPPDVRPPLTQAVSAPHVAGPSSSHASSHSAMMPPIIHAPAYQAQQMPLIPSGSGTQLVVQGGAAAPGGPDAAWMAETDQIAQHLQNAWDGMIRAKTNYSAGVSNQVGALQALLDAAQADKASEIARYQKDLRGRDDRIATLQATLATAENDKANEIGKLRREQMSREQQFASGHNAALANATKQSDQQIQKYKSDLERAQNDVQYANAKVARLEEAHQGLRKQLAEDADSNASVVQAREAAKKEVDEMKHQMEAMRTRHEAESNVHRDHVRKNTAKMAELEKAKDEEMKKLKVEHEAALKDVSSKGETRIRGLDRVNASLKEDLKKEQANSAASSQTSVATISQLRDVVARQAMEIKSLQEAKSTQADTDERVKGLDKQVSDLTARLAEREKTIKDTEEMSEELVHEEERRTAEAKEQLEVARKEVETAKAESAAIRGALQTVRAESELSNKAKDERVKVLEEDAKKALEKVKALEEDKAKKAAEYQDRDVKSKGINEKFANLESIIKKLQASAEGKEALDKRVGQLEADKTKLEEEKNRLEAEKVKVEKAKAKMQEERDELDTKLGHADTQRLEQMDAIQALRKETTSLKKVLKDAEAKAAAEARARAAADTMVDAPRGRSPLKVNTALAGDNTATTSARPTPSARAPSPVKGRATSPAKGRPASPVKGRAASPVKAAAPVKIAPPVKAASVASGTNSNRSTPTPAAAANHGPNPTVPKPKIIAPLSNLPSKANTPPVEPNQDKTTMKRKRQSEPLFTPVDDVSPTKPTDKRLKLGDPKAPRASLPADTRDSTPSTLPPVTRDWVRDHIGLMIDKKVHADGSETVWCRCCHVDKKNAARRDIKEKNPRITDTREIERMIIQRVGDMQAQEPMDVDSVDRDLEEILDHLEGNHDDLMRRLKVKRDKEGKD